MSTIVTRSGKGSPLTNQELDNNFTSLNTDKAELSGAAFAGAITTNSTFDGRDVATDGTKLDGVEASADVTDATNVTAAGALMDSELTSIASVKALNQGVATGDSPTFAAVTSTGEITANGGIALGDSDAATFGDSDDLSISHAGGNTYLTNTTGSLVLRSDSFRVLNTANSEQILHGDADGAVSAYYNNALKLATTSTGIDVTGTATMDGLVVEPSSATGLTYAADGTNSYINFEANSISDSVQLYAGQSSGGFFSIGTKSSGGTLAERLRIDSSGNVGIGRVPDTVYSGSLQLAFGNGAQLSASTAGNPSLTITDNSYLNASGNHVYKTTNPSTRLEQYNGTLTFSNAASGTAGATISYTERMRIDSSGNVGIGCTPSAKLHIKGGSDMGIRIESDNDGYANLQFGDADDVVRGSISYNNADDSLQLRGYNNTERMRIDSSGNVLVGNTDSTPYDRTSGNAIALGDGLISSAQSGGNAAIFNRMTNDGSIVQFRKNGTTVGSIGTYGGTCYMGGSGTLGGFMFNGSIEPTRGQTRTDAAHDLGSTAYRFKDLYLSGGVVFGTTGGSVSSKTLDDYEEGTWTPLLVAYTGTNPSVSGSSSGFYTKIGNLVTVSLNLDSISVSGTTSGIMKISGLPFTPNGDAGGSYTGNQITLQRPDTSCVMVIADGFGILSSANGGNWAWELVSIFDGGSALRATVSYKTNS